jgi:hypothetical protein
MSLLEHLQRVDDARTHRTRRCELLPILTLALCATIGMGAKAPQTVNGQCW